MRTHEQGQALGQALEQGAKCPCCCRPAKPALGTEMCAECLAYREARAGADNGWGEAGWSEP